MSFANGRHTAGKNSTEWMETCNMIKEKMRGYEKWCKKLQLIMVSPASERRFWNAGFHLTVALFLSEGGPTETHWSLRHHLRVRRTFYSLLLFYLHFSPPSHMYQQEEEDTLRGFQQPCVLCGRYRGIIKGHLLNSHSIMYYENHNRIMIIIIDLIFYLILLRFLFVATFKTKMCS